MRRTAAATVALVAGLGFGIPDLFGIRHFAETGRVWMFLGFPTYGDGPFERIGIRTSVPLLAGLLGVCAAEIVLGVLILKRSPVAKTLSRALLPVEFAAWLGFALPLGPVLSLGRFALLERAEGPDDLNSSGLACGGGGPTYGVTALQARALRRAGEAAVVTHHRM